MFKYWNNIYDGSWNISNLYIYVASIKIPCTRYKSFFAIIYWATLLPMQHKVRVSHQREGICHFSSWLLVSKQNLSAPLLDCMCYSRYTSQESYPMHLSERRLRTWRMLFPIVNTRKEHYQGYSEVHVLRFSLYKACCLSVTSCRNLSITDTL